MVIKEKMRQFPGHALCLALTLLTITASAQVKSPDNAYQWHDGGDVRTLYLDPALTAEFNNQNNAGKEPVLKGDGIRIWRKEDGPPSRSITPNSPVFRDYQGGSMRALPGNIIVHLNPTWNDAQVAEWLTKNNLVVVRSLPMKKHLLVIASPTGLPSLELANRLVQSGTVVSAQPEWWEQRTTR